MQFAKFILPVTALFLTLSACNKEKDTIARIHVVDTENVPVSGATVRLVPEGSENKEYIAIKTATTNSSGEATFDLTEDYKRGQAGVAVLKIDVNGGAGTGIIKIVEEETSEETVFL